MQNHFDLFQLPRRFAIDMQALNTAYHEVQGRVHPDKFVNAIDAEKRVAMQWATRANEAYQILKSPLKRATYLCELQGVDLQVESNTAMPAAFLMQQMAWREALDDARDARQIEALAQIDTDLRALRAEELAHIEACLDAGDYNGAGQAVRKLMFVEKFGEEVGRAFDALTE